MARSLILADDTFSELSPAWYSSTRRGSVPLYFFPWSNLRPVANLYLPSVIVACRGECLPSNQARIPDVQPRSLFFCAINGFKPAAQSWSYVPIHNHQVLAVLAFMLVFPRDEKGKWSELVAAVATI